MAETASEIKLFGKWTYDDVEVNDISLEDYIAVKGKHSVYLPHTAGRYQKKRFRKALCPIVERLVRGLPGAERCTPASYTGGWNAPGGRKRRGGRVGDTDSFSPLPSHPPEMLH